MGAFISTVRNQLDQSAENEREMHERLNILEKMVNYHLDIAKQSMLTGVRGDQEIHTGTVVAFKKEVIIQADKGSSDGSSSGGDSVEGMIKDFFGGQIKSGIEKLILGGVNTILGNNSMGEHEDTSMFIVWSNNSLLRLDSYIYKWKFQSKAVITDTESVMGVITMTRVINLAKTDPQVLTWAISTQAQLAGEDPDRWISDAVDVIKKVSSLQQAVHAIEVDEKSKGIGEDD